MPDYPITAVTRRTVLSGSAGTGPYAFSFPVLTQTDLDVYKDATKLTLTTDYTVSIGSAGTGTVTLEDAATGSNTITIVGARAIQRTTDFVTAGDLLASSLNTELDSQTIFAQQTSEDAARAIKAPVTDPTSIDMSLPAKATRATKVLGFDSDGDPTVSTLTVAAMEAGATTATTKASEAATSATAAAASAVTAANEASAAMPKYNFSTTTSVADPGVGRLRLNHGTPSSASVIIIDDQTADTGNPNVEDWLKGFDDSTSTIKGYVRLVEPGTPANYAVYNITGLTDSSGFIQLAVSHVDSQGTFGDGDSIRLSFARTGDKGDTGSTGSTGSTGPRADEPGLRMIFSTATADSDQGAGKIHLNNGTASSATIVYVDDVEAGGASINSFVDSWDDSTNTALRGTITIKKNTAPENFHIFNVTGVVTSASTYSKVAATHVLSAGTISNSDSVSVQFVRTGNAGSLADPMTTRGDVIVRDSSNATARLAVGSANTVLKSDGTDPAYGQVATAMIADDAVTLAKMAGLARGKIISGDASGNPQALALGGSGTVLTSDGTDAAWAAAAAGGKLLQAALIPQGAATSTSTATGTSATAITNLAFTPTSASSKLYVLLTGDYANNVSGGTRMECNVYLSHNGGGSEANVAALNVGMGVNRHSTASTGYRVQGAFALSHRIDSPGTSEFTIQVRANGVDILGNASSTGWVVEGFVYEIAD